jgi:hypothetical protein
MRRSLHPGKHNLQANVPPASQFIFQPANGSPSAGGPICGSAAVIQAGSNAPPAAPARARPEEKSIRIYGEFIESL